MGARPNEPIGFVRDVIAAPIRHGAVYLRYYARVRAFGKWQAHSPGARETPMTADPYSGVPPAIVAATPAIERISTEVWNHAELSLEEVASAEVHTRELEAAGFTITSRGTSGQSTAFVAEWEQGMGGPRIGFLPEYDALPGLGNAAVPRLRTGPEWQDERSRLWSQSPRRRLHRRGDRPEVDLGAGRYPWTHPRLWVCRRGDDRRQGLHGAGWPV